jgi:hypothetical protein
MYLVQFIVLLVEQTSKPKVQTIWPMLHGSGVSEAERLFASARMGFCRAGVASQ